MRIHTDTLTSAEIILAASAARVSLTRLDVHGSRKRARAFDVILSGSSSRRQNGGPDQAATWDEWGDFLGHIFGCDPNADTPYYHGAEGFHTATGSRYDGRAYVKHAQHKFQGYPTRACECGAIMRYAS